MSRPSAFAIAVGAIGAAAAISAGAAIAWFALLSGSDVRQAEESAESGPGPITDAAAQPDDGVASTPPFSTPHFMTTKESVATSSALIHDPAQMGTAYLNARDEVEGLLNGFRTGRIVIRSRIVETDREYAASLIRGVVRDMDALGGTFVGGLSETFDIALFPDSPCTFSHVESGFRRPRSRAIETSPGVFASVPDEAGGEVLVLDSHCGSRSDMTSAQVRIDTAEETVRVELANDRVVQWLVLLDTEGFMAAVEFDATSFPPRNQNVY